ncbi:hypothetical protein F5Y15DRAFT_75770 [Xylariaceae sp. FL0016]|nr:hypothetical protein F5Y15DRAFT_75770 [Xylariaceae sp. FL0016]
MPWHSPDIVMQQRKRAKVACGTCRELKRKCDGAEPCGTCVRFEYSCSYAETSTRRRRAALAAHHPPTLPPSSGPSPSTLAVPAEEKPSLPTCQTHHLLSLEANSGAAFVRKLALGIDPSNAPRMHLFGWNAFLGARHIDASHTCRSITDIVSRADMAALTDTYFDQVDPVYGFIDRRAFEQHVRNRWVAPGGEHPYDAVLCGVAALGFLFSRVHSSTEEREVADVARSILQRTMNDVPCVTAITGWILRVAYLRMTGTPHAAWMASSMLMHMVEAAGLHCEPTSESVLHALREDVDPETRRQLFGVAHHLNIWMSFDLGRSRVLLHNVTTTLPSPRPGNYTNELLELLPYSALLDPSNEVTGTDLEQALVEVVHRTHSVPPSIMAQTNLMLCICRRLKQTQWSPSKETLDRVLYLIGKAVSSAETMVDNGTPWHHMANVPFQAVCMLLVIDNPQSIAELSSAMRCLSRISATYNMEATQEALKTASLLITLHQRRKQRQASHLNEMLKLYPVAGFADADGASHSQQTEDATWLETFMAETSSLQDFDIDQFLSQDIY